MDVVYWSQRKTIDIVLENKLERVYWEWGGQSLFVTVTILRKATFKEVAILSFSNVADASASYKNGA